jgi:hypothetical protein
MKTSLQATVTAFPHSSTWNKDLGLAWANMFQSQQLDPTGTVLEIGPGFTDKIAFGLAAFGFRGRVILVDPSETARCWAVARYRQLLPQAEVISLRDPLPESTALKGESIDAVVSNHIFDDLLLNAVVPRTTSLRIFSAMHPDLPCSSLFLETWKHLLSEPTRLEMLVIRIADEILEYLDSVQPNLVVLNHYLSWRHSQCGLGAIHDYGLRTLRELHRQIGHASITSTGWTAVDQTGMISWLVR